MPLDHLHRSLMSLILAKRANSGHPGDQGMFLKSIFFVIILTRGSYSDIGTAEDVLGKNLPTPLQLPW